MPLQSDYLNNDYTVYDTYGTALRSQQELMEEMNKVRRNIKKELRRKLKEQQDHDEMETLKARVAQLEGQMAMEQHQSRVLMEQINALINVIHSQVFD